MSPDTDKTRETRLRRQAARQGLRLQKSPRRDPSAHDFGTYQLVDDREGWVVLANHQMGQGYGVSLDDIEEWLNRRDFGEWLNRKANHMYKITALMTARPYPPVTTEQRRRYTDAIHQLHSSMILKPTVEWNEHGQALVTLACAGEDASSAAERAEQIIENNAAINAYISVQEVTVTQMEILDGPWD